METERRVLARMLRQTAHYLDEIPPPTAQFQLQISPAWRSSWLVVQTSGSGKLRCGEAHLV
jgi:hypothetical protein